MSMKDDIDSFLARFLPRDQFSTMERESLVRISLISERKEITIYPDWWQYRRRAVENHLIVKMGKCELLHGRETHLRRVSAEVAEKLFETTHLAGYMRSKIKLGLFHFGELAMCATFANPRKWTRESGEYTSAEMIGLCSGYGLSVRGGAEKLIAHYIDLFKPDELVTFSDNSFSSGDVFRNIGFQKSGEKPPMGFVVLPSGKRKYTVKNPEFYNLGYTKWVLDLNTQEKWKLKR